MINMAANAKWRDVRPYAGEEEGACGVTGNAVVGTKQCCNGYWYDKQWPAWRNVEEMKYSEVVFTEEVMITYLLWPGVYCYEKLT